MSRLYGSRRYPAGAYPVSGGLGGGAAVAALSNRYLIDPAGPIVPAPFTVSSPTLHIVAAANIVRRASGHFSLAAQVATQLASSGQQAWTAFLFPGVTATGGTVNGDWLVDDGTTIVAVAPGGATPIAVYGFTGDVINTVSLVGVNASPAPAGDSAIVIMATTVGGIALTSNPFFGSLFELP